jgi:hypothetical protein
MMFELNPIEILKQRKLATIPAHFKKIAATDAELYEGIEDWIKKKLKGRYVIARQPSIDRTGVLRSTNFIGFEDQKELTYFMLACPLLRRN